MAKLTKAACYAAQDFEAVENRDHEMLTEWMDSRGDYTIVRLSEEIGIQRSYLNEIFLLRKPLTEKVAALINEATGLDLWGIPTKKGRGRKGAKKRKVVYV